MSTDTATNAARIDWHNEARRFATPDRRAEDLLRWHALFGVTYADNPCNRSGCHAEDCDYIRAIRHLHTPAVTA